MAKKKEAKKEVKIVEIHALNRQRLIVNVVGDGPLYVHRLSAKYKKEVEGRNGGKAIPKQKTRDIDREYREALYWLDKNGNEIEAKKDTSKHKYWGFPASGFKKCAISACRAFKGIPMTQMRGAFHVNGYYVMIEGTPRVQKQQGSEGIWVRIGGKQAGSGTPDLRYRPEFPEWKAKLNITYNANMISPEQIFNLFNTAGFMVGVGEDRPDKSGGTGGMFHVE